MNPIFRLLFLSSALLGCVTAHAATEKFTQILQQLSGATTPTAVQDRIKELEKFLVAHVQKTALRTPQESGESLHQLSTLYIDSHHIPELQAKMASAHELITHIATTTKQLPADVIRTITILQMLFAPSTTQVRELQATLKPALTAAEEQTIEAVRWMGNMGNNTHHRAPYRTPSLTVQQPERTAPLYRNTNCANLAILGRTAVYHSSITRRLAEAACLGFFCAEDHPYAAAATRHANPRAHSTLPSTLHRELSTQCHAKKLPVSLPAPRHTHQEGRALSPQNPRILSPLTTTDILRNTPLPEKLI